MSYENEAEAYSELTRLNWKLKLVEKDFCKLRDDAQMKIRKQQKMLAHMDKERTNLLLITKATQGKAQKMQDKKNTDELEKLAEKELKMKETIKNEKRSLQELEEKIKYKENRIKELELVIENRNIEFKNYDNMLKKKALLERTYHQTTRINNILLANIADIREEIQSVMKEKGNFADIYTKTMKNLNKNKKTISLYINEATKDYDQTFDDKHKIKTITDKIKGHNTKLDTDIKSLHQRVEINKEINLFIKRKLIEPDYIDDDALYQAEQIQKQKEIECTEKVQYYDNIFEKLHHLIQAKDFESFEEDFLELEHRNLITFRFSTELIDENERLKRKNHQTKTNLKKLEHQEIGLEEIRSKQISELESQLNQVTNSVNYLSELARNNEANLQLLQDNIVSMFNLTNCEIETIEKLLGCREGIKVSNMFEYLVILEYYICEMVALYDYASKESVIKFEMDLRSSSMSIGSSMSEIGPEIPEPPTLDEVSMWCQNEPRFDLKPISTDTFRKLALEKMYEGPFRNGMSRTNFNITLFN